MTLEKYSDVLAAPDEITVSVPGSYTYGRYAFSMEGLAIFCGWINGNKARYYSYDYGTEELKIFNVEIEE